MFQMTPRPKAAQSFMSKKPSPLSTAKWMTAVLCQKVHTDSRKVTAAQLAQVLAKAMGPSQRQALRPGVMITPPDGAIQKAGIPKPAFLQRTN